MRFLYLLCAATILSAQTPATVQILSDTSQILVGRTLQMRAVVRDAGGNLLSNAAITWSSNNTAAASVSSNGLVTAARLAVVRITARAGNVAVETAIQTIPSRVAITPDGGQVNVLDTLQFAATAYDADDNPIPGVNWIWSITNLRSSTSQTARISSTGVMSAIAEGANFVWATFNYSDVQTGLQRQWVSYSRIETTVPTTYKLRRLYNNVAQQRAHFELRARQSMLWSTTDGDLYFNASLDGLAGGLMRYRNGQFQLVSTAGLPRFAQGSFANEFFVHSITRSGRILSHEDTNNNGRQLSMGDRNGVTPFFANSTPLVSGTEATSGVTATRHSLSTNGQLLIRASFRFENDTNTYAGIFRGFNGRITELLLHSRDSIPELPGVGTISIDGDYGIADDGTAFYSATLGSNRIFFKHPAGEERQKLIGVNDAMLGSTVRSIVGSGRGNQPNFWVEESNGTVILPVTLNNNNSYYLAIDNQGQMKTIQYSGQTGILWHDPIQGTLLQFNPFNNQGNGVYLWNQKDNPKPVFLYSKPAIAGANIEDVESGTITSSGQIYLMGRTSTANMAVFKLGDNPEYVFYSGISIDLAAPVNTVSFILGARSGPPHLLTGGTTGSVSEFNGTAFTPRLAVGERIFGSMWYGGFTGSTGSIRKSPTGDIYVIVPSGIARLTDGAPELVVRFPLATGGITLNNPSQLEINSRGDILFQGSTSAGDNRMCIWSNGTVTQLVNLSTTAATASTIDGRIVSSFDSFAIGDDGRVMASLRFRGLNVPVLYLYANQTWTRLAEPNLTQIGAHRVTGIANLHRTGAGRIFATLSVQAGGNIVAEWKGSDWEILVNISSVMPNGQVANSIANLESNRNGDLLFQQSNGNNFLLVRRADEPTRIRQLINLYRPTPEGDYLVRINAIDFRDDGTVYFLAMTSLDETVLYEAKPL